jgi:hypothetical protein
MAEKIGRNPAGDPRPEYKELPSAVTAILQGRMGGGVEVSFRVKIGIPTYFPIKGAFRVPFDTGSTYLDSEGNPKKLIIQVPSPEYEIEVAKLRAGKYGAAMEIEEGPHRGFVGITLLEDAKDGEFRLEVDRQFEQNRLVHLQFIPAEGAHRRSATIEFPPELDIDALNVMGRGLPRDVAQQLYDFRINQNRDE